MNNVDRDNLPNCSAREGPTEQLRKDFSISIRAAIMIF